MNVAGVGLVLLMLVPLMFHWRQRRDARYFLGRLAGQPPVRTLTDDEQAALQPLRACLGIGNDRQVRTLSGAHARHVLQIHATRMEQDTIGDVNVVLPYDAFDHLAAHNDAEVVLGPGVAVVVRLNEFHIGSAARAWRTPTQVCGERLETNEERTLRRQPGVPWAAAALALLATFCAAATQWDVGASTWAVFGLGLLLAALSAALSLRRQVGPAALQTIVHVRGRLNRLQINAPTNAAIEGHYLLVGNDQRVEPPHAWRAATCLAPGTWIDAEIYRHSRALLTLGPGWSVLDEQRRFAAIPVARHAVMFAVALLSLGCVAQVTDGPGREWQRARQVFSSWTLHSNRDPVRWRDPALAVGDGLHVHGYATCELVPSERLGRTLASADCSRLRWGAPATAVQPLPLPDAVQRLDSSQRALRVHGPSFLGRPLQRQQVAGLSGLLEAVEDTCAHGLEGCPALQAALLDALSATMENDRAGVPDWSALRRAVHAVDAAGEGIMLSRAAIEAVREAFDQQVLDVWAAQTPALLTAQHGGTVLVERSSRPLREGGNTGYGAAYDEWQRMRMAATIAQPTAVSGAVTARNEDGRTLWLQVDSGQPSNGPISGLASCLWMLAALVLALFQGAMLLRRLPRAIARDQALAAEIGQRPPPPTSSTW